MTTEIKRRRGTTAQHATFTGGIAEITVDTDKNTLVVHDGATAGGFPLALEGAGGIVVRRQKFTSSGTYTPHANMLYCDIEVVGGGGGGGGATGTAGQDYSGGGGGSGAYSTKIASK